jgi:hypothetical protein
LAGELSFAAEAFGGPVLEFESSSDTVAKPRLWACPQPAARG